MKKLTLLLVIMAMALFTPLLSSPLWAQGQYEIRGALTSDALFKENKTLKKVYLSRLENGLFVPIDSAEVKDKTFVFRGEAPVVVERYFITGFDNGEGQIFLEPGQIIIPPFDARYPASLLPEGTPNNDVIKKYKQHTRTMIAMASTRMQELVKGLPQEIREDKERLGQYETAQFNSNTAYMSTEMLSFALEHADQEASLYIVGDHLISYFTPRTFSRRVLSIFPSRLKSHPKYLEILDRAYAMDLSSGRPMPNVRANDLDGNPISLSDLKGKYVLLDFWASWCAPCRREIPYIKEALAADGGQGRFVVLSFSIDQKPEEWHQAVKDMGIGNIPGWYNIGNVRGFNSSFAKMLEISAIPATYLINPQGLLIVKNLRGEKLVEKVKNILSGKERYE